LFVASVFRRSFIGAFYGVDAVYLPFLRRLYADFTPCLYGGCRRVIIMAICKICGADRKLMNGGVCSPCLRAIPPKDNQGVTPAPAPALVERDSGIVDALKAQSESIDALVDMVETNWLAQMAESNQAEDIEPAEPALSDEDDGASVLNGVVLFVIALFVAALVVMFRDRFKSVPPAVAPTNGSKGEYIS
jgi:hypothetical protein